MGLTHLDLLLYGIGASARLRRIYVPLFPIRVSIVLKSSLHGQRLSQGGGGKETSGREESCQKQKQYKREKGAAKQTLLRPNGNA